MNPMVVLQTPLSRQVTLEKALRNLLLALLAPAEEHVTPQHPLYLLRSYGDRIDFKSLPLKIILTSAYN